MSIVQTEKSPEEVVASLSSEKVSLEAQLEAQRLVLETNGCTMTTPLVDDQGFPVANIDIPSVRKARIRVLELRNDLEKCMESMAKALEAVYASRAAVAASVGDSGTENEQSRDEREKEERDRIPFAKVDGVAPDSPAHAAGLQREDLLVSVSSDSTTVSVGTTENPMARLVSLVGANENVRVSNGSRQPW